MKLLPSGVDGGGPKWSMLIAIPGPFGKGMAMIGQTRVRRDMFGACLFKQWRRHHRVHTFMSIQERQNRSNMRSERVVPMWQEAVE